MLLVSRIGKADAVVDAKLAALDAAAKSAQSAGDNAWMLMSAALVLMMTGPGLALFSEVSCARRTFSAR